MEAQQISYEEYARKMREVLSSKDMRRPDLSLNHQYFNTKKGHYWSEVDNEALVRGLKKHPVGEWKRINQEEFAGKKYETELELRTCLLLGINDLRDVMGRTLDVKDFDKASVGNPKKRVKRL